MSQARTANTQFVGISRLHPLTMLPATVDGQPAYLGQNIRVSTDGERVIGGTFAPVYSDTAEDANSLAKSMNEAWNERMERLRGEA